MYSLNSLSKWAFIAVLIDLGVLPVIAAESVDAFPNKAVRIVVPQASGGGIDLMARLVGARLSGSTGQSFVVDNRTGAGSIIGATIVAKAAPDGYTLLVSSLSMAFNETLYKKLPYDSIRDFTPLSLIAISPNVLTVSFGSPVKTVQELIQLANSRPGKLNYGSGGIGGSDHVCSEYFQIAADIKLVNVSYRGSAPALVDLAAGMIDLSFAPIASSISLISSGKLRALGVSTVKRSALLPEVPTMAEAGLARFDYSSWYAIWGPGGLPRPIVSKLNSEMHKALRDSNLRDRMAALGAESSWSGADEFSAFYEAEIKRWEPILKPYAQ